MRTMNRTISPSIMGMIHSPRWMSVTSQAQTPSENSEDFFVIDSPDTSTSNKIARARGVSLPISPKKMSEILRRIRGFSAREAIIQLRLAKSLNANYVAAVIGSAVRNAVHNHSMNQSRLLVHQIWQGKGITFRKPHFMGRGRFSLYRKRKTHLWVELIEQPYKEGEVRIGKYGRRLIPKRKKTIEQVENIDALHDDE